MTLAARVRRYRIRRLRRRVQHFDRHARDLAQLSREASSMAITLRLRAVALEQDAQEQGWTTT